MIISLIKSWKPEFEIILPMPPSTNKLYMPVANRGRSRMVTTKDYRAWQTEVSLLEWTEEILLDRKFVSLEIQCGPDFRDSGDCDNLLKAPIDSLVKNGVIVNDSKEYVAGCISFFGESVNRGVGRVVMSIYPEELLNGKKKPRTLFDMSDEL